MVQAVHGGDEGGGVGALVEVEVVLEGGLGEGGGDDGGGVAVGHGAERHGDDDSQVNPVELTVARGEFGDHVGWSCCERLRADGEAEFDIEVSFRTIQNGYTYIKRYTCIEL